MNVGITHGTRGGRSDTWWTLDMRWGQWPRAGLPAEFEPVEANRIRCSDSGNEMENEG